MENTSPAPSIRKRSRRVQGSTAQAGYPPGVYKMSEDLRSPVHVSPSEYSQSRHRPASLEYVGAQVRISAVGDNPIRTLVPVQALARRTDVVGRDAASFAGKDFFCDYPYYEIQVMHPDKSLYCPMCVVRLSTLTKSGSLISQLDLIDLSVKHLDRSVKRFYLSSNLGT